MNLSEKNTLKYENYIRKSNKISNMEDEGFICYGEKAKLDHKDRQVLSVLDKNARASIAEISRKTGIQRDSVLYRLKRMKDLKVIRFFHTVLNPSILGHHVYSFVNFTLSCLNKEKENTFLQFLKRHPNVVYIAKTTGKWDYTINVAAENLEHFDKLVTQIRRHFSEIIKDYETSSIIQEYKYDSMVGLV